MKAVARAVPRPRHTGLLLPLLAAAILILIFALRAAAESPPPSYQIFEPPAFMHLKHHKTAGYFPGAPVPMTQHAYAYGWFGSPGVRMQMIRSHGYRNDYSQKAYK